MPIEPVTDLDDPRLDDFRNVRDRDLVERRGVFMAEGRLVVRTLLSPASRFRPRALLVTPPALDAVRADLANAPGDPPVYLASQGLMDRVVGFPIHRGCLAAGERGADASPSGVLEAAAEAGGPALVLEDIANHDNVGGIFRNAAAFGAGGVLLSPRTCSPLYRKALRVSMGACLRVPFAAIEPWPNALSAVREAGFTIAALTPSVDAVDLGAFAEDPARPEPIALLVGAEGPGLSARAWRAADVRLRIPMAPGVDSLTVSTATGIALHRFWRTRADRTGQGRQR